jgi:hypothetical protein
MMLTITIPDPTHIAQAKLRSKIQMVNAIPRKTKVKIYVREAIGQLHAGGAADLHDTP